MRSLSMLTIVMLVFSTTFWAAEPEFTGTLQSTGSVLTNDVQVPGGGTVRAGDVILAGPGSLGVITSAVHGRVEVRSDSVVRFSKHAVHLDRGAVAASRVAVETGGYTIRLQEPARPNSWFAVANRGGRLLVAAHRGNVVIASSTAPALVVNQGTFAQQQAEQESTSPQADQPEKEKKGKKDKAAAAAAGGWTIGGLSHAASVALVVGLGAGAAAAAAGVAVSLGEEAPSPSQ